MPLCVCSSLHATAIVYRDRGERYLILRVYRISVQSTDQAGDHVFFSLLSWRFSSLVEMWSQNRCEGFKPDSMIYPILMCMACGRAHSPSPFLIHRNKGIGDVLAVGEPYLFGPVYSKSHLDGVVVVCISPSRRFFRAFGFRPYAHVSFWSPCPCQ